MHRRTYATTGIILFLLLAGAGCAAPQETPPPLSEHDRLMAEMMQGEHEGDEHHVAELAGKRVVMAGTDAFAPGEVTFSFQVFATGGGELASYDLETVHEKRMHFLLVRDDMTGFQHLHPEYREGRWTVTTEVPEAGQYQVYIDIDPLDEAPVVLRVPVTVGGPTAEKRWPEPAEDRAAEADGLRAALSFDGDLETHKDIGMTFALTKDGAPVEGIEPYLGAYGHVVLLRHNDPDDFFHVHPVEEAEPKGGKVGFVANFPLKGRYTLYAQFKTGGVVRTFPITVDVTVEGEAAMRPHEHYGEEEDAGHGGGMMDMMH